MTNFINFHVLISHSPACLNRDDMNMQKDAVFGGKRRVRISSQSLKRAFRKSDYYANHFGSSSIRTRQLALLAEELGSRLEIENEEDKDWIHKTIKAFTSQSATSSANDESNEEEESVVSTKKVAVAPWSLEEFKELMSLVKTAYQTPLTEKEEASLAQNINKEHARKPTQKKPRKSDDEIKDDFYLKKVAGLVKDNIKVLSQACGQTLDIALSGRMATSGLMTNIDGALSLAHSITTHTVNSDIDWFTAVDDLQPLGSGHLDTQEFSAGVFYRYASLNISQLQENLGNADRAKALDIASHLAHLLATETPNAKQRSFAAFNPADLVMVSFSDFPMSLANAFEQPVKQDSQGGYLSPSIKSLNGYWEKVAKGYGLNGATAQFQISVNDVPEGITSLDTLASLKEWIRNNGEV
ncbi:MULTISPECIES: type I-E CRISPR-associated protein Cas7/Cse4/CasC [Marinomonas]|uniref:Type I-E CRISPR-associated protein Cas7/Cse4/CasC n=1 Tax=Marinomonas rhodophyticola TaxID=2992803 RepID=A0ABT3KFH6_9GAMM|nr:type I-E CRISPR-associated protein Cas7/Cse4/CasC [Marinomonas sp. KJ51-3]MCW4629272.1 type I-E CRISPR-associated protein Cas7/Cse4/CasC [Marinomonas sp. KJ51-3]